MAAAPAAAAEDPGAGYHVEMLPLVPSAVDAAWLRMYTGCGAGIGTHVDDEENQVRSGHRDVGFSLDCGREAIVNLLADASRVDDFEGELPAETLRNDVIARHSGLVMNDGNVPSREGVEQG